MSETVQEMEELKQTEIKKEHDVEAKRMDAETKRVTENAKFRKMKIGVFKIAYRITTYDRPADAPERKPFARDAVIPWHDPRNVDDPRNRVEFRPGFPDHAAVGHGQIATIVVAAENLPLAIASIPKPENPCEEIEVMSSSTLMHGIDLAGSKDERNPDLRAEELRGDPLYRDTGIPGPPVTPFAPVAQGTQPPPVVQGVPANPTTPAVRPAVPAGTPPFVTPPVPPK